MPRTSIPIVVAALVVAGVVSGAQAPTPQPGAAKLKTTGSTVVSTGGEPATLQGGVRAAIMPDPNGLFLVLIQAPQR